MRSYKQLRSHSNRQVVRYVVLQGHRVMQGRLVVTVMQWNGEIWNHCIIEIDLAMVYGIYTLVRPFYSSLLLTISADCEVVPYSIVGEWNDHRFQLCNSREDHVC